MACCQVRRKKGKNEKKKFLDHTSNMGSQSMGLEPTAFRRGSVSEATVLIARLTRALTATILGI